MNLPNIDVTSLPDLNSVTGMFGSLAHGAQAATSDDTFIMMMVFLYDFLK